jgi:hypothetical protein
VLLPLLLSAALAAAPPPVIGGTESGAWPAVAVLELVQGSSAVPLCSGTLVGPGLVLTAAHCGADLGGLIDAGLDIRVGFGPDGQATETWVESVVLHPDWSPDGFEDDLALLRVEPVGSVEPMALLEGEPDASWVGGPVTGVGYGDADEVGGGAGTKRVLELEVLDVDAHFVLMDAPGDANLCSGDSGGPVLHRTDAGTVIGGVSAFIYRDDGEQGCTGGQTAAVRGDRARKWLQSIESGEEWDGVWRSQGPGLGSEPAGGCASAPAAPILAGLLWLPALLWRRQSAASL